MFNIKLDTWISITSAYREISVGAKKVSLQWFPYTRLSKDDWDYLCSEEFYTSYIQNGSFVLFKNVMHHSENYIQKSDGSFRDASLVSPLLFLVLQAIGGEIAKAYEDERPFEISSYYAGDYTELHVRYKREYDSFFKELNAYQEEFDYYIKTDITSFFSNINVDKLIERIDKKCNEKIVRFTQVQLQLVKELLLYTGGGRFPLIENSMMSSYLATIVYLDQIDCNLCEFIKHNVKVIKRFKMVRYVDDLYILFSLKSGMEDAKKAYVEIRNEYSSILKEWGLALNSKKCKLGLTREINQELKKSLYDELFNGKRHCIEELCSGSLEGFLKKVLEMIDSEFPDVEQYNEMIDKYFSYEDIEFTADEVFNFFVFESDSSAESEIVSNLMLKIIRKNIAILSLDPKRLGVLVMKTHSERAIKATLNELFERYRNDRWNSYDTTIAIAYLVQSEFRHIDLLAVLKKKAPRLYTYYYNNCRVSFIRMLESSSARSIDVIRKVISKDWKSFYLYFMYIVERDKSNNLTSYAFFKNFFDRVTADLDHVMKLKKGSVEKRPNYKAFYKESILSNFYSCIEDGDKVLKDAHKMRNDNPVSHSSASLIDNDSTSEDIENIIDELKTLIKRYIAEVYLSTVEEL